MAVELRRRRARRASIRAARPAAGQDRERVADRQRVLDVVGDEDDAEPAVAGRDRVAQDDRRLLDAERRRRLVEDQDPRPEVLGPGDRQRLALATRQGADELVRVADVDPDVVHLLAWRSGAALSLSNRLNGPNADRRLVAEEEVAADAHQRHDREVLVDRRDARVERVARRVERRTGWPSTASVPSSGGWTPDSVLIRVDLPAPLSPRRQLISPARTVSETPSRATTAPKYFEMLRASRSGVASAADGCVGVASASSWRAPSAQRRPAKRRRIQLLRTTATSSSVADRDLVPVGIDVGERRSRSGPSRARARRARSRRPSRSRRSAGSRR